MARKKVNSDIPSYDELIIPTVKALVELGGSGTVEAINERVYEITKLSDEVLQIPHGDDGRSEVDYRLAWSRTYLRKFGLIENSSRGIWSLSKPNINVEKLNYLEIVRTVRGNKINNSSEELKVDSTPEITDREIAKEVENTEN